MTRARRALGRIAVVWLLCQATTLTLAPTLLAISMDAAGLGECTCIDGADANCPMHHKPAASSKDCVMRSLTTGGAPMLKSLLGLAGFLQPPTLAIGQVLTGSPRLLERSIASSRTAPPDPPPPRA